MLLSDTSTPVLTARQSRALVALLTASDVPSAAKSAGVAPQTLFRWLRESPDFKTAYRDARREVVSQAVSQISAGAGAAVGTLRAVCDDGDAPAGARVSAAKTLLDLAFRGVELDDLSARVESLETDLAEFLELEQSGENKT